MNYVSKNEIFRDFWGGPGIILSNVDNNAMICFLITGRNDSISSSSENNQEKSEGPGRNQTNHENVLDMETKNNISITKSSLTRKKDSILSALPICRDIPSRIHVEVW